MPNFHGSVSTWGFSLPRGIEGRFQNNSEQAKYFVIGEIVYLSQCLDSICVSMGNHQ